MTTEHSCCGPAADSRGDASHAAEPARALPAARDTGRDKRDEVVVPGGRFAMGDAFGEGYAFDGEGPVHEVELDAFRIDVATVTVNDFATFVASSGYVSDAERAGSSAVFHAAVRAPRQDVLGSSRAAPWWLEVAGADWRHPFGRGDSTEAEPEHPVVHVSWFDAQAYCAWANRALPTEAQWEYAARGGLDGARYPWGDDLTPQGKWMCNIWQGTFPRHNTSEDGWLATAPARSFAPNGFGLHQMSGNVWEWCADWFSADTYATSRVRSPMGPDSGDLRVMRGGSYLCHASYCNRYRVSARSSNTPESTSGNCGFRTVGPGT